MVGLDGQVVVVFGASSGVGLESARAFAAAGAAVVMAARRADIVQEEARRLVEAGGRVAGLGVDVSVRAEVDAVIGRARAEFGRVDVMVNAAGINVRNRWLKDLDDQTWQSMIQVNLTGAYNTIQAVLPLLRSQQGGLIIQISSISGRYGDTSGAAYQASKHGMVGLCYAVMAEEHAHGIRASAILPGLIDTPLLEHRPVKPAAEVLAKALQPEDVAQACLFLASLPPHTYVPELILLPGAIDWIGRIGF